ncbi:MAG: FAD-dependent oxidoreductase [Haloferacaceae archaeon]
MTADAVVIGGGATGVATARDLAMRGVDVHLVERDGLSAGTTGRSHGVLHSGARYAESDPADARECIAENRRVRSIAGACVRETGGLFVSLDGDDPDYAERKLTACRNCGIDADPTPVAEARERIPGLADDARRAFRVPDAVVSPARLVAATAADASDRGATIHLDAPVSEVTTSGGAVTGVTVDGSLDARISAGTVVNAAGPWADRVAGLAGASVPLRPTRGAMVAVEYGGIGPVVNRCRPPADGDIVVPRGDGAILGTTSVAVDDPDDFRTADWEVERTVAECAAMVPALADAPVERTYWGVRPLYEPGTAADERDVSRGFAVLDHADEGAEGLLSVVGGKLTTHRLMAEAAADRVCARLAVDAPCRTADEPLARADDPAHLDRLVTAFDARAPADGTAGRSDSSGRSV